MDGYVGNEQLKTTIAKYLEQNDIQNYLFHGQAGTGKTTLAKIVINNLDCESLYINASDERGIETIRDKVVGFASVASFKPLKVVILDEADLTSGTATTSFPFATTIYQFSETVYNSAELVITATDGTNRHITKLLVIHDGTTAFATEFATIYTNASLATYDVSMSGGNVIVNAVAASSNSTTYNISATLLKD